MEAWLRNNEHTIKILGIVVAAIFTLFEYFGHLSENRVQQTLVLYKEYSSTQLIAARNGLVKETDSWWPEIKKMPEPTTQEAKIELRGKWRKHVLDRLHSNIELTTQTVTLLEFFDSLQVCIENNICDKKTAHDLLSTSAKELAGNFCPYIAEMRYVRMNMMFADKANAFAGNVCHAEIYK